MNLERGLSKHCGCIFDDDNIIKIIGNYRAGFKDFWGTSGPTDTIFSKILLRNEPGFHCDIMICPRRVLGLSSNGDDEQHVIGVCVGTIVREFHLSFMDKFSGRSIEEINKATMNFDSSFDSPICLAPFYQVFLAVQYRNAVFASIFSLAMAEFGEIIGRLLIFWFMEKIMPLKP